MIIIIFKMKNYSAELLQEMIKDLNIRIHPYKIKNIYEQQLNYLDQQKISKGIS